jgi:excisionase family DNA binding protein
MENVPENVAAAVVALLGPYVPGLSVEGLCEALSSASDGVESEWLTIDEAAAELKVHRATVHRRIADGTLAARKIGPGRGGAVRVSARSLRTFVNEGTVVSA